MGHGQRGHGHRRNGSFRGFESDACRLAPSYQFRVMLRAKGIEPQIAWATNDGAYAHAIAAQLNALAREERAWVEAWDETRGRGWWVRLDAPTKGAAPASGDRPLPLAPPRRQAPRSGELVRAVLLAERTRRGGWRARLVDYALEGPLTGAIAAPAAAGANQTLTLRVAAANADGSHLQLEWP